jgi:hypothetical protein
MSFDNSNIQQVEQNLVMHNDNDETRNNDFRYSKTKSKDEMEVD